MEEAYNRIVAGGEKRGKRQERDTMVTAWHEAGHAILGAYYDRDVPRVTIVPTNKGAGGYTLINPEEKMQTKEEMFQELQIMMGGRIAEEITFGPEKITGGASADLKRATEIAMTMVANYGMSDSLGLISISGWAYTEAPDGLQEGVRVLLDEAYKAAKKVLIAQRRPLDNLAKALLERETLVEKELAPYFVFDKEKPAA
jgi:cell division protease FtsH